MIDLERAMTGTTLTINKSQTIESPDEELREIAHSFLTAGLGYTSTDDVEESPPKNDQELEEDLNGLETGPLDLETGPLEMEEMHDLHEDLNPRSTSALEADP